MLTGNAGTLWGIWREADLASESPLEIDQVKGRTFALTSANLVPPKLNFHTLYVKISQMISFVRFPLRFTSEAESHGTIPSHLPFRGSQHGSSP